MPKEKPSGTVAGRNTNNEVGTGEKDHRELLLGGCQAQDKVGLLPIVFMVQNSIGVSRCRIQEAAP